MPAKVKVKILACRNLPVMDKSNDTTDAYVEIKLGNVTFKTDVKRKSLNPTFNSTWFRFEIDDLEIQDEPLTIRVMDYDTYSANDAIGKVSLNLSPLLLQKDISRGMNGWIPIYDTMNGIRGEINFIVKVELFSDSNKFRQSSCGVQFFHSNTIPYGYHAIIRGFVEELAVDDDPEHDWLDKIRRASASNEARQTTFMRLAGQVQRKIGLKALNMGGNAVVGYRQNFDLEKDTIVSRGIGTCVTLVKIQNEPNPSSNVTEDELKSDYASKSNEDIKSYRKCVSDSGSTKTGSSFINTEHSKSLLSVPSICVDNIDSESNFSNAFDTSSISEADSSIFDTNSVTDPETISMIVRNIENIESKESESKNVEAEIAIPKTSTTDVLLNVRSDHKHDFIHDLKDSLQTRFHHLSGNNKKHENSNHGKEQPLLNEHGKSREILHDFKENMSEKFHQIAEKFHNLHMPHLPSSHHNAMRSDGLTAQGLETMLMDKFNIVEACSSAEVTQKRKSSASSLQSIKEKFNVFQRPKRPVELISETSSLRSISEVNCSTPIAMEKSTKDIGKHTENDESSSPLEPRSHEETESCTSNDSFVTVLSRKHFRDSVDENDSHITPHKTLSELTTFANTNKKPLHESLLSLSRNEPLSTSPNFKLHPRTESVGCKFSASPSKNVSSSLGRDQMSSGIHRRSSDSDLSITPKGNSLTPQYDRISKMPSAVLKPMNQENMDMLEYPFMTLTKYPAGFIVHIGATVSARSVKLLEKVAEKDDIEARDSWFNELRMEIRGHAKSLGCNVILGYAEYADICDDVTVLSATGTAAVINFQHGSEMANVINPLTTSVEESVQILEENSGVKMVTSTTESEVKPNDEGTENGFNSSTNMPFPSTAQNFCSLCHIPYSRSSIHIGGANIGKCCICKRGYVPDVILATIELPEGLSIIGTGCLIQATVCRPKRDLKSESNAKEISDALPFLEYELHRLLINKLKVKGMNAIFRLSVQVTVGDKMMALIATGTAVYLSALHASVVPKIVAGNSWNDSSDKLAELQKSIQLTVERNREMYQLVNIHHNDVDIRNLNRNFSDTDDSDNEEILDYGMGSKQTCILEIDDIQDLELFSMLMEPSSPEGIQIVNSQNVPGAENNFEQLRNLQMFTQVWRMKIPSSHQTNSNFSRQFQRLLQSIFFKLRGAIPCTICEIQFHLDLPADEIQLLITGMVLKATKIKCKLMQSLSHDRRMDEELMFSLEEEDTIQQDTQTTSIQSYHNKLQKKNSGQSQRMMNKNDKFVELSPLSWVPSGKIERYLGNVNFSFIRETQNVREYGGICGFVHSFITELLAIVRAHISALGGNLLLAFYMTKLVLIDNPHKNQAQCLVQVGGDAVYCSYSDEN
ncbi:CLUMA_CG000139, isoform B [Clunio marinus]|uniref:CLUMA_CG000139, isoform B n=1 Tax=Clunio marinus TaxID=568069 RepID=A0A1J1HDY5_9DIPT|nr:CLUMA_CG000139, isoform B [Clunio marinus]